MSKIRINAEWIFGDIINYLKFLDFKKGLKLPLAQLEKCIWYMLYCKMYILSYMVQFPKIHLSLKSPLTFVFTRRVYLDCNITKNKLPSCMFLRFLPTDVNFKNI